MEFNYTSNYSSLGFHGFDDVSTPRPWDLTAEILYYADKNKNLLDIGCGTAYKIIPLAPYFREIMAVDVSMDMIKCANVLVHKNSIDNIQIVHADSSNIPFPDHSFDVITCMLSRWDAKEIARLLNPNGVVIIEHIGCEDKKDFKMFFGKDEKGWRGQFIGYQLNDYLSYYKNMFDKYFSSVSIQNGYWQTFYSESGLLELLTSTPTIRNFEEENDLLSFKKSIQNFKTTQGIMLKQNRILICAKNF